VLRARHASPPLGRIAFTVPALQWVAVILAHRVSGETIDMAQDPVLLPESARVDEVAPLQERRPSRPYEQSPRPRIAAEPDWRRILGAIRRRRWLVLGVTLLGTAAGIVAAVRFVGPRYLARARLWVGAAEPDPNALRGTTPPPGTDRLLGVEAWVDFVRSDAVLDTVVREVRLYLAPRTAADSAALVGFGLKDRVFPGRYRLEVDRQGRGFTLVSVGGGVVQRGAVGDSVGPALGFAWVPGKTVLNPGRTVDFTVYTPHDAAEVLAGELQVTTDPGGSFLTVQLTGTDPHLTTAIVRGVANRTVAVAAELRRHKVAALAEILGQQVQHAQASLTGAELALKDFRIRTAGVLPAGVAAPPPSPAFTNAFELRVTLDQLARDRQAIDRFLAQPPDSELSADALVVIDAVQKSPELMQALKELTDKQAELRALRYTYTDQNFPVQQLADAVATLEHRTIPALLRAVRDNLAVRERDVGQRVDSTVRYLSNIPPLLFEQTRLEREVQVAGQLYASLQQHHDEARVAEASAVPDVRILDAPDQPYRPIGSLAPFVLIMSFLASAGLGVLGAVLVDSLDPRFRDPGHVTQDLGLRILGALPHLSRAKNGEAATQAIEAMRTVRVKLQHACNGGSPLLLTVTSPGVGEGKSLVSANLALAFAYAGLRTVVIDGDIRRGALHRLLRANRRPGLTDHLTGRAPLEQVLQTTPYKDLSFIGCGSRMHNSPELLSATTMVDLLAALRSRYDVVLVDTAPLAAGADPYTMASHTKNLLVVLRAGVTDLELAQAKLESFDDMPVRVVGSVLNDVRAKGAYRYYAYYVPGYETKEEADLGPEKPVLGVPDD